jgi:hypothetical protein
MINHLQQPRRASGSPRRRKPYKGLPRRRVRRSSKSEGRSARAKAGWTPERRARQAALIRRWKPWRHSTGPKTELGKARCAMNATPHAVPDAHALAIHRARKILRLAARNLATLRAVKRAASFRAKSTLPGECRVANPDRTCTTIRNSLLHTRQDRRTE